MEIQEKVKNVIKEFDTEKMTFKEMILKFVGLVDIIDAIPECEETRDVKDDAKNIKYAVNQLVEEFNALQKLEDKNNWTKRQYIREDAEYIGKSVAFMFKSLVELFL